MRAIINGEQFNLVDAYASDGTHKTDQIFLHMPNVSPLLDYKLSQVAIASEKYTIRMDGTVDKYST